MSPSPGCYLTHQGEALGFSPQDAHCTPFQSTHHSCPLLCTSVLGRPPPRQPANLDSSFKEDLCSLTLSMNPSCQLTED